MSHILRFSNAHINVNWRSHKATRELNLICMLIKRQGGGGGGQLMAQVQIQIQAEAEAEAGL